MNTSNTHHKRQPGWVYIIITMMLAVLLTVIPVPESVKYYWPDWITLVVFYWVLVLPAHLGVMFGWINGLIEDIVNFSLLGQHALGKALTGTVAAMGFNKFRLFNFLQKMFLIVILQSISIAISAWTNHLAFSAPVVLQMWLPALTTALMWPLVSFLMDQLDPGYNA
jgi:rod shape-determining protein MreD